MFGCIFIIFLRRAGWSDIHCTDLKADRTIIEPIRSKFESVRYRTQTALLPKKYWALSFVISHSHKENILRSWSISYFLAKQWHKRKVSIYWRMSVSFNYFLSWLTLDLHSLKKKNIVFVTGPKTNWPHRVGATGQTPKALPLSPGTIRLSSRTFA